MSIDGLIGQTVRRDQSEVRGVRKIVVYELLSLDGVAEAPDSFFADWDEAMDANLAAVIATQDAVILGRRTYTAWAQFWPDSQIQIAPRIVGRGRRLLDGLPPIQLESIRSDISPTGYLLADYRVIR